MRPTLMGPSYRLTAAGRFSSESRTEKRDATNYESGRFAMSRASEFAYRSLMPLLKSTRDGRVSQFEVLRDSPAEVVMLGDSITEQGIWNEWFPQKSILNRGIGGDTSTQLLDRMDVSSISIVTAKVFLLIGTNDISQGVPHQRIVSNVEAIILRVQSVAPNAQLVLQSVMPRKTAYTDRLKNLNRDLQGIAAVHQVAFLDLWPALSGPDGGLRSEFTIDKLHLTGAGYAAWFEVLRPHMR